MKSWKATRRNGFKRQVGAMASPNEEGKNNGTPRALFSKQPTLIQVRCFVRRRVRYFDERLLTCYTTTAVL
jgi:hypothetical protein